MARDGSKDGSKRWSAATGVIALAVAGAMVGLFVRANSDGAPMPALFVGGASTLDEAMERAGNDGLVFAYATADWCPPCKHYKRTTLSHPDVEAWVRERATPVYIDVDVNTSDAGALGVRAVPQTTVLRGDGTVVVRLVGAVRAEELLERLRVVDNR